MEQTSSPLLSKFQLSGKRNRRHLLVLPLPPSVSLSPLQCVRCNIDKQNEIIWSTSHTMLAWLISFASLPSSHRPLIGIIVTQCNLLLRCVAPHLISSSHIYIVLDAGNVRVIIGTLLVTSCYSCVMIIILQVLLSICRNTWKLCVRTLLRHTVRPSFWNVFHFDGGAGAEIHWN